MYGTIVPDCGFDKTDVFAIAALPEITYRGMRGISDRHAGVAGAASLPQPSWRGGCA
jgi:hypothetical protein